MASTVDRRILATHHRHGTQVNHTGRGV
jgi:hypothetical protein